MTTGFLHPGQMGVSLAATCTDDTVWASEGRSAATAARAAVAGVRDVGTLAALVAESDVVVSICPPESAVEVAELVAALGFEGIFVDANAIAPATARQIATRFDRFVDGSVIGPPATQPGHTTLSLSGPAAAALAGHWKGDTLDVSVLPGGAGAASALKMAYAGWTKGSTALLLAMRALAEAEGVGAALLAEWEVSQPGLAQRLANSTAGAVPKAWRWVGEMQEIAETLVSNGLPGGFHAAAADLYARLAGYKDATPPPPLDEVVKTLLAEQE